MGKVRKWESREPRFVSQNSPFTSQFKCPCCGILGLLALFHLPAEPKTAVKPPRQLEVRVTLVLTTIYVCTGYTVTTLVAT